MVSAGSPSAPATGDPLSQATSWQQAWVRTQSPIDTMTPVSSATPMNSSGASSPRWGWRHRSSASTPSTTPVRRSTMGW